MKKTLLILLVSLSSNLLFSQDSLFLSDGRIVVAKILEINPSEIKYTRFDMLDGPTYIESKQKINKIIYKNGSIELIEHTPVVVKESTPVPIRSNAPVSIPQVKFIEAGRKYSYNNKVIGEGRMYRIMDQVKDPELIRLTTKSKKAKGVQFIGFAAIPAAIATAEFLALGLIDEDPFFIGAGCVAGAVGIGCGVTGLTFVARHKKFRKKAVEYYNQKY